MKPQKKIPEYTLSTTLNGQVEQINFPNLPLISTRAPYNIDLLMGLNDKHELSHTFESPKESSIEYALIEFVKTGDQTHLNAHQLIIVEHPREQVISRNLTLLDPINNEMYVLGSVGLVSFRSEDNTLILSDPVLDESFHDHQDKHNRNPGGVVYISEAGVQSEDNATPLGVSYIEHGPYSLLKKIEKTLTVQKAGINTPKYLFAGRIKNLGQGQWGFSIYKTPIQPDYLKSFTLYLDASLNLKTNFLEYLNAKYKALRTLHDVAACSHAQPTIENAGCVIDINNEVGTISCILKDMDTLRPLPKSKSKTIIEGPCPQRIGINIKKSPFIAAQTYDLQLAITQELNIVVVSARAVKDNDQRLKYIQHQFSHMMQEICKGYGINEASQIPQITRFCFAHFINGLKRGHPLECFHDVLGGLAANAIFGFSKRYQDQIEVIPE